MGGFLYLPKGIVQDAAVAAGAFVATPLILNRLPLPAAVQTGYGNIAAQAVVTAVVGGLLARFAGGRIATAFVTGGLASAALSLLKQTTGMSGYVDMGDYTLVNDQTLLPSGASDEFAAVQGYVNPQQVY